MSIPYSFDKACRELFKGWSTVATYRDGNRLHVHLTLEDEWLARKPADKAMVVDQLFSGTGLGLYGRKR